MNLRDWKKILKTEPRHVIFCVEGEWYCWLENYYHLRLNDMQIIKGKFIYGDVIVRGVVTIKMKP